MDEWRRNVRITSVITGLALQRQLRRCFHGDLWQECFCNLVRERYKTSFFPVQTVRAHLNMQEVRPEAGARSKQSGDASSVPVNKTVTCILCV